MPKSGTACEDGRCKLRRKIRKAWKIYCTVKILEQDSNTADQARRIRLIVPRHYMFIGMFLELLPKRARTALLGPYWRKTRR